MTLKRSGCANWIAGLVAAILLLPVCASAKSESQKSKRESIRPRAARKITTHHAARRSRHHHVSRRYERRRQEEARRRSLHLSSDRVTQIQQALVRAGYLKAAPDGHWGPETAEAMREFQLANGFDATGLPEAKALMKLGLGPHPLPSGLSVPAAASSSSDSSPASASAKGSGNDPRRR